MGALAAILDRAFSIGIERDWVVVLCLSPSEGIQSFAARLRDTNVTMSLIYLVCKVSAPAIAGFVIPLLSKSSKNLNPSAQEMKVPCFVVGALNVVALVAEFVCTERIHALVPGLAIKKRNCNVQQSTQHDPGLKIQKDKSNALALSSFRVYMSQSVAFFGLGLAVLNLNPLTFGNGIMATYLLSRGMVLEHVGALRGIACAIGLLGTAMYRFLSVKQITLEAIATCGISFQFVCVVISLMSVWCMSRRALSLILLTGGVCLSRIGLWIFSVATTQLQQERVPENARAIVGGFQESINAFFNFAAFGLGTFFPDPDNFDVFIVTSALSVGVGLVLTFTGFARSNESNS